MHVAYLINRYPAASHSFIRREIAAVEADGIAVSRFTIRSMDPSQLPDQRDREELEKTTSLLALGAPRLLLLTFLAMIKQPLRAWAAIRIAFANCSWRPTDVVRRAAYLAEAAAFSRQLRDKGIEHVHAHFGTNPATVARIAHAISGVPYSFTVHGPDEFDAPLQLDLAGKIADSVFCVAISSFGRSQLMRWSDPRNWSKIKIVRCGVDDSFIDRASTYDVPAAPSFCSVARISAQKGIPLLVEAAAELKRRGRTFRLTLVGDGEMRGLIEEAIADRELDDFVVMVGLADSTAVIAHLENSRAMVLPSFAEGLPVVIMEALSIGRPVIVSAIAGTPELVDEECGWLVSAGSVSELVVAMEKVLDATPDRLNKMGQVGRSRVLVEHDSRRNGRQLAAMFRTGGQVGE